MGWFITLVLFIFVCGAILKNNTENNTSSPSRDEDENSNFSNVSNPSNVLNRHEDIHKNLNLDENKRTEGQEKCDAQKNNLRRNRNELARNFKRFYIENGITFSFPYSVKMHFLKFEIIEKLCKLDDKNWEDWRIANNDILSICFTIRFIHTFEALYKHGYIKKLYIKRCQLIAKDEYDESMEDERAWFKEVNKFLKKHYYTFREDLKANSVCADCAKKINKLDQIDPPRLVEDLLRSNEEIEEDVFYSDYFEMINMCVIMAERFFPEWNINKDEDLLPGKDAPLMLKNITKYESFFSDADDPLDLVEFVEDIFSSHGWTARRTLKTEGQGADIIAERNGKKVVIQCKLCSKPVGNKAIQEVAGAMAYYQTSLGMVVTNSDFTKSAKQLAKSLNVTLQRDKGLSDSIRILNLVFFETF